MEFETDDSEFECLECGTLIKVGEGRKKKKPVQCEKCKKFYMVRKNPKAAGLLVDDKYEPTFEEDEDLDIIIEDDEEE